MTKRVFEAMAQRFKADLESSRRFDRLEQQRTFDAVQYAASAFADVASQENGRFDRSRFMKATGLTDWSW